MGLKEYLFGFKGENMAAKYLVSQGFEILEKNFHSKFGEIDIIAKKDDVLHFVEVKS
ncbi:YraN family protein, partial [Campylobacter fetus]